MNGFVVFFGLLSIGCSVICGGAYSRTKEPDLDVAVYGFGSLINALVAGISWG